MIRVARESDERVEREPRVGVPRIDGAHAPGRALESPMLEVIDRFQKTDREERLEQEDREGADAERGEDRERDAPLEGEAMDDAAPQQPRIRPVHVDVAGPLRLD